MLMNGHFVLISKIQWQNTVRIDWTCEKVLSFSPKKTSGKDGKTIFYLLVADKQGLNIRFLFAPQMYDFLADLQLPMQLFI